MASFNLHFGGFDRSWRPFDVPAALAALATDVIVLQEVVRGEGDDPVCRFAAGSGYRMWYEPLARVVPARRGPGLRAVRGRDPTAPTIGIAILSRVASDDATVIELGTLRRDPLRRAAQQIRVGGPEGPLTVVGTHMSQPQQGSPIQLRRLAAALPGPGTPALVAGDMNISPLGMRAFLPRWRPAVRGRTFPAGRPVAQLDHLMVTPVITVLDGRVVAAGRSDHLAVRTTVRW